MGISQLWTCHAGSNSLQRDAVGMQAQQVLHNTNGGGVRVCCNRLCDGTSMLYYSTWNVRLSYVVFKCSLIALECGRDGQIRYLMHSGA